MEKTSPKNTVTPTVSFVSAALARATRGMMLYTFDEKIIINVAKVKRDLRHDGCRWPVSMKNSLGESIPRLLH